MAYVFYDTETTGLKTRFDQILQFAAIKTDAELNELEVYELRCRLRGHVVPSPGALLKTRVTPDMLIDSSLCTQYEAIQRIRSKLASWSPATFIGFNTISFDEELLRSHLFQTLHPPYLTNTGGNCRSDVLRIARAANLFAPGSIAIPQDNGKETFKLDKLAPANGFSHSNAHDALSDVRATIHVAKLLRKNAPDVWKAMDDHSRKNVVMDFLGKNSMFTVSEMYYGKLYSWMVVPCGTHQSQMVVFDLAYDPDVFKGHSVEELIDVMNSSNKAIRTFRSNAQPILAAANLAPESTKALKISEAERTRRAQSILNDSEFQNRVCEATKLRYADEPKSDHFEEQIYDGFANEDEPLMAKFHGMDWDARCSALSQFKDARIIEFAHRLTFLDYPDGLSEQKRQLPRA